MHSSPLKTFKNNFFKEEVVYQYLKDLVRHKQDQNHLLQDREQLSNKFHNKNCPQRQKLIANK